MNSEVFFVDTHLKATAQNPCSTDLTIFLIFDQIGPVIGRCFTGLILKYFKVLRAFIPVVSDAVESKVVDL